MKTSISYIVTGNGNITAIVSGKTYVVPTDFPTYGEVRAAIKAGDSAAFASAVDMGEQLRNRSKGTVSLVDGVVTFAGLQVNNVIVERILNLVKLDLDVNPYVAFLQNCLRNVEPRAIDELYLFLEANSLPITEDGCFLAYRRVDKDYLSIHKNPDGTRNSNKVGEEVKMTRAAVDPDRDRTCSKGLHFCSMTYLPHYGSESNGDRTVIVKVAPADVVSIPSDYNNQKGRCCRYKVVAEHLDGDGADTLSSAPVYQADDFGFKPSGQKFYAVRDTTTGRFTAKA